MLSLHHPTLRRGKDIQALDSWFQPNSSRTEPRIVSPYLPHRPPDHPVPYPTPPGNSSPRSSIDILPPELLGQIFLSCISTEGRPWRDNRSMTLTHVCIRWRALSLSLSDLWSTIMLTGGCCTSTKLNRYLQMWLERSRGRPLKIFLPHNAHNSMIYPIISNIHRCDELIIDLSSDDMALAALHIPFAHATLLHTLAIGTANCRPDILDQVCALACSAPNMRQLSWEDHRYFIPGVLLNYPWCQLSHIIIAGRLSLEQFYLLQRSPNLEHIEVGLDLAPSLATPSPIKHPKLSSLNVHTHRSDLSAFLDILTLPSLQILHLHSRSKPESPRVHTALENMLARSGCKLEALTLDFALERDIVACITCPSLRFLREVCLNCCDKIGHATVERLFLPPESSTGYITILPRLSKLSLSGCLTTDGMLAEMVVSRWRRPAFQQDGLIVQPVRLSFVSINFWRYSEPGRHTQEHDIDNEVFKALIKEGLDIRRLWIFRLLPL